MAIIVHVSGGLDAVRQHSPVSKLEGSGGIVHAEFCSMRSHLMLVRYDRDTYSIRDVLRDVAAHNLNARLIGPV